MKYFFIGITFFLVTADFYKTATKGTPNPHLTHTKGTGSHTKCAFGLPLYCDRYCFGEFLSKLLGDSRRYGYFISLQAKINGKNEEIEVKNHELFYYVTRNEGIPKNRYAEVFKDIIGKAYEFKTIPAANLLNYTIAVPHPGIDCLSNIGIDTLVKFYFRGKYEVIKDSVWGSERAYLVKKLFDNKTGCMTDDETGYLHISRIK